MRYPGRWSGPGRSVLAGRGWSTPSVHAAGRDLERLDELGDAVRCDRRYVHSCTTPQRRHRPTVTGTATRRALLRSPARSQAVGPGVVVQARNVSHTTRPTVTTRRIRDSRPRASCIDLAEARPTWAARPDPTTCRALGLSPGDADAVESRMYMLTVSRGSWQVKHSAGAFRGDLQLGGEVPQSQSPPAVYPRPRTQHTFARVSYRRIRRPSRAPSGPESRMVPDGASPSATT